MVVTKLNPVGIDWYIQNAQNVMYSRLMTKWGNVNYNGYGRCYRNKKESGYIAEIYTGSNEYKEVYWDDTLDAISFFSVGEEIDATKPEHKVNVGIIFFVNIAKIKPSIVHRGDEEIIQDGLSAVGRFSFAMSHTGTVRGIDNVLKEYTGTRKDEGLKAVDMHPIFSFRLNYQLIFDPNKKC